MLFSGGCQKMPRLLLLGTVMRRQAGKDVLLTGGAYADTDMDNFELGVATRAYVEQTFGLDEIGVGYEVIRESGISTLYWNRSDPEPTEDQLAVSLNKFNWDRVRIERNKLLAATDFYALSDVVMSDEMKDYRQALRDLPASTENSADVVFPTPPE